MKRSRSKSMDELADMPDGQQARLSPILAEAFDELHIDSWSAITDHSTSYSFRTELPCTHLIRFEYNHVKAEFRFPANLSVKELYYFCICQYNMKEPFKLAVSDYSIGVGPVYHDLLEMTRTIGELSTPLTRLPIKILIPNAQECTVLLALLT